MLLLGLLLSGLVQQNKVRSSLYLHFSTSTTVFLPFWLTAAQADHFTPMYLTSDFPEILSLGLAPLHLCPVYRNTRWGEGGVWGRREESWGTSVETIEHFDRPPGPHSPRRRGWRRAAVV